MAKVALAIRTLLYSIGEDPTRDGLEKTPDRVAKAYKEWFSGYTEKAEDYVKAFDLCSYNQMIIVRNIPVYSHCEHHMVPFFGVAHIGYIPNGKILGLSKFKRIVDVYAHRLQIQERLTEQVCSVLFGAELGFTGVGVVLECRHLCMESRGVCTPGTTTNTTALMGIFLESQDVRNEFFSKLPTS